MFEVSANLINLSGKKLYSVMTDAKQHKLRQFHISAVLTQAKIQQLQEFHIKREIHERSGVWPISSEFDKTFLQLMEMYSRDSTAARRMGNSQRKVV